MQDAISPLWSAALDGCDFVDTADHLEHHHDLTTHFHLDYTKVELPMPISLLTPHIVGRATKKNTPSPPPLHSDQ